MTEASRADHNIIGRTTCRSSRRRRPTTPPARGLSPGVERLLDGAGGRDRGNPKPARTHIGISGLILVWVRKDETSPLDDDDAQAADLGPAECRL